jgi:hypothetical protein
VYTQVSPGVRPPIVPIPASARIRTMADQTPTENLVYATFPPKIHIFRNPGKHMIFHTFLRPIRHFGLRIGNLRPQSAHRRHLVLKISPSLWRPQVWPNSGRKSIPLGFPGPQIPPESPLSREEYFVASLAEPPSPTNVGHDIALDYSRPPRPGIPPTSRNKSAPGQSKLLNLMKMI